MFIPLKYKELYLVHVLNEMQGNSFIIFCSTCNGTLKLALMLRNLGLAAIPLNGHMSQNKRLGALNKFKTKARFLKLCVDSFSIFEKPNLTFKVDLDRDRRCKSWSGHSSC